MASVNLAHGSIVSRSKVTDPLTVSLALTTIVLPYRIEIHPPIKGLESVKTAVRNQLYVTISRPTSIKPNSSDYV